MRRPMPTAGTTASRGDVVRGADVTCSGARPSANIPLSCSRRVKVRMCREHYTRTSVTQDSKLKQRPRGASPALAASQELRSIRDLEFSETAYSPVKLQQNTSVWARHDPEGLARTLRRLRQPRHVRSLLASTKSPCEKAVKRISG